MILRKPYAFLIKHFRLIHLVITLLFGLVAFKTRGIYIFLKKVIVDTTNRYDAVSYINYGIIGYIFLALILCFLVGWLLKYKDKPRTLYKFTIGIYIVIVIFLLILFGYMGTFSNAVAEQKTIRLYRDILTMLLIVEYLMTFIMLIRGLGFDLKKFDFKRDLAELSLEDTDSEEVEVNVDVDTTNVMRMARKGGRELGYFYKEFKTYIIIILLVVFGILGFKGYNYLKETFREYAIGDTFGGKNMITIKEGYYYTDKDKTYVIINFDIYKYGVREQFNTGDMVLSINRNIYQADKNICYKFNSLGTCYKKQYITESENNYLLVYELDELKNNKVYIIYTDYYQEKYKVKLYLKEYKA